ncbi:MAG: hypothetical protein Q7S21_00850 [archaeon]|nr:hypothetical protein [archaeon]
MPARKPRLKKSVTKKGVITKHGKTMARETIRELFEIAKTKPNPIEFFLSKNLNAKNLRALGYSLEDIYELGFFKGDLRSYDLVKGATLLGYNDIEICNLTQRNIESLRELREYFNSRKK